MFQFNCQTENLTVVLTLFWPYIVDILSVVSILFLNGKSNRCLNNFMAFSCRQSIRCINFFSSGKSNRCFNNFLAFHCRQSICRFNSFFKWKISPLFQQFFTSILGNLPVVSVFFSNGESNCFFNNFFALHCKQSIRCFKSFLK